MCQFACYPSSRCHLEPLLMDETLQKFDGHVCEYFHLFFFQLFLVVLLDRLQIHTFTLNFFDLINLFWVSIFVLTKYMCV